MAIQAFSSARRRNVTPTSSVLATGTVEDVDCSGTAFAGGTPEDGEFVVANGLTATTNALVYTAGSGVIADVSGRDVGSGLRMVWASAQRSDRSALGQQRVPVFKKAVRVKTKLFGTAAGAAPSVSGYVPGVLLSVGKLTTDLQGSQARLVLTPFANNGCGWAVGKLERVISDSAVSGTAEIEVSLFESPIFIGN